MYIRVSLRVPPVAVGFFVVVLGLTLGFALPAQAQVTQVYSFESGLEGFGPNGGSFTTTLNTDPSFSSEGTNSQKVVFGPFGTFSGALTSELKPEFGNPPGVDFLRFDFINPTRFVPEEPGPSDPTFCDVGISVFGVDPADPNTGQHVQFFATQKSLGSLDPGTHEIEIDLTAGGLLIGGSEIKGFNEWFGDEPGQLVPTSFQLYFNKNFGLAANFGWTFYIDNIRVGRVQQAVDGDYNGNGSVDAADYTVWRDNLGLTGGATPSDGDGTGDGNVTSADYDYWKARFGTGAGSGALLGTVVPEPASLVLASVFTLATVCGIRRRGRA